MNKKLMGTLSLVLAIVSGVSLIMPAKTLDSSMIISAVGILIAVVAVVFGFLGKKENKGMSIAGIILGIIAFIVLALALIGAAGMKNATDCVDKGNGTYSCKLYDQDVEIPAEYVREDQIKK